MGFNVQNILCQNRNHAVTRVPRIQMELFIFVLFSLAAAVINNARLVFTLIFLCPTYKNIDD